MSNEAIALDNTTGEEAKAILLQIGWFADTCFLSLRFTDEEFQQVQESLSYYTNLSPEQAISAMCDQDIDDHNGGVRQRMIDSYPLLVEACKVQLVSLIQRFDEMIGMPGCGAYPMAQYNQAKQLRAAITAGEKTP